MSNAPLPIMVGKWDGLWHWVCHICWLLFALLFLSIYCFSYVYIYISIYTYTWALHIYIYSISYYIPMNISPEPNYWWLNSWSNHAKSTLQASFHRSKATGDTFRIQESNMTMDNGQSLISLSCNALTATSLGIMVFIGESSPFMAELFSWWIMVI